MYQALYRTYRPEVFQEVLGQEHIIKILKNQINTHTVSHAYLFCGTRGTGKTTTARILAKGVNCTSKGERPCGICDSCKAIREGVFIDVIEIDAASNNGVDNIRELRESVKYPPATGQKKVYIIDEVHMLSTGAFNALLKTLEEPPENVMFILATTEPQKLPATILSRCMRLDFKRVSENLLQEGFAKICSELSVEASESALRLIAVNADGSVRDGLSILDQCLSGGERRITREDVLAFLGASGEEVYAEMTAYVVAQQVDEALLLLDRVLADGKDVRQFMRDWLAHYRNLLIAKYIKNPEDILNMSCENAERIREQSESTALSEISRAILEISKMTAEAKWSTQPRILLELCIVKLAAPQEEGYRELPRQAVTAEKKSAAKIPAAKAPQGKEDRPKEEAQGGVSYEALWTSLFSGADGLKGSFNVLLGAASIGQITDTECVVAVQKIFARDFIEKNKSAMEEVLEKRTGKRLSLVCIADAQTSKETAGKPVEKLAEELESKFGINIEIEE